VLPHPPPTYMINLSQPCRSSHPNNYCPHCPVSQQNLKCPWSRATHYWHNGDTWNSTLGGHGIIIDTNFSLTIIFHYLTDDSPFYNQFSLLSPELESLPTFEGDPQTGCHHKILTAVFTRHPNNGTGRTIKSRGGVRRSSLLQVHLLVGNKETRKIHKSLRRIQNI
jgi:hypothetical protein